MDIEKLRKDLLENSDPDGPCIEDDLMQATATALSTIPALQAELEKVMRERNAAQSLLAERIGVRGAEPITTAFGLPIDRLRKLAQADRKGLLHIIQGPDPGAFVCGNCRNFIRNPGTRVGVCTEQSCYRNHRGNDEPWRGTFSPSQSRKACRKFVRAVEEEKR